VQRTAGGIFFVQKFPRFKYSKKEKIIRDKRKEVRLIAEENGSFDFSWFFYAQLYGRLSELCSKTVIA
jgi:hypothetical protein